MSLRLSQTETPLSGLFEVKRAPHVDGRGFLERVFCTSELSEWQKRPVVQINRTLTEEKGTLRGMHFQKPPFAECKYVSCLAGAVYDVAVDLRVGSTTFGKWFGLELKSEDHNALLIPEGFAHGFQALTDDVEMLYLHSAAYAPDAEGGLNALDPELGIDWPMPPSNQSTRDASLMRLAEFGGISL